MAVLTSLALTMLISAVMAACALYELHEVSKGREFMEVAVQTRVKLLGQMTASWQMHSVTRPSRTLRVQLQRGIETVRRCAQDPKRIKNYYIRLESLATRYDLRAQG